MDWDESWRDACRELLRLRRIEIEIENPKKGLSWQTLRNEIMRDYEYDGSNKVYEDKRLKRNDLANFDKGMRTSSIKFKFIDRYIRKIDVFGMSDQMRRVLRLRVVDQHLKVLWSMYGVKSLSSDEALETLKAIPLYTYAKNLEDGEFNEIFFAVDHVSPNGAGVVIGYCRDEIRVHQDNRDNAILFFYAYLIPMDFDGFLEDFNFSLEGQSHINIKNLKCLIKAFRPEYRGLQTIGYADGEALITHFKNSTKVPQDDQHISEAVIEINYPNTLASPFYDHHLRPDRFSSAFVSQRHSSERSSELDPGGMSESNNHDYFDTDVWRINLETDIDYDNYVAELINKVYKGYVF